MIDEFKTKVFQKLDIRQIHTVNCTKKMETIEDSDFKTLRSLFIDYKIIGNKLNINYQWKVQRFFFTVGNFLTNYREVSLTIPVKLLTFLKKAENKHEFMSLLLDYRFPEVIEIKSKESIYIKKRDPKKAAKMLDKFLKN